MKYFRNFADLFRKFKTILYTTILSLLSWIFPVFSNESKKQNFELIENFKRFDSNLPLGWKASRDDVSMFFPETEMNYHFLRIHTIGGCTSIGKQIQYSAKEYPFLIWKWRTHKLPIGGNETLRTKNDSGAGIYVIFKGQFKLNHILKYVWSTTLPKGTLTTSPYNSRTKIIVLRNHTDSQNTWFTEKVNVYDDYLQVFRKVPPPIVGIGILTDADNTATEAVADYGEIGIMGK